MSLYKRSLRSFNSIIPTKHRLALVNTIYGKLNHFISFEYPTDSKRNLSCLPISYCDPYNGPNSYYAARKRPNVCQTDNRHSTSIFNLHLFGFSRPILKIPSSSFVADQPLLAKEVGYAVDGILLISILFLGHLQLFESPSAAWTYKKKESQIRSIAQEKAVPILFATGIKTIADTMQCI